MDEVHRISYDGLVLPTAKKKGFLLRDVTKQHFSWF